MMASKSTMTSIPTNDPIHLMPIASNTTAKCQVNMESYPMINEGQLKLSIRNNSTANRFTAAQRDRTLRHHKLLQPTSSQEKVHLSRLRSERQTDLHSMRGSSVSLLTLPEEEEKVDEVHLIYNRASSIHECHVIDDVCRRYSMSLSTMSQSTKSTASLSDSHQSISDEDDSDQEDEEYLSSSPYPAELKSLHSYCQPCEIESHSPSHRFVVCADTQFGITTHNVDWDTEIQYSHQAIDLINEMEPRPAFVCICGDLVDMEFSLERKKGCKSRFPSTLFNGETGIASREVCDAIQDEQNQDFKETWSRLHSDIALVCLCGNHDLGNRPTPRSISRFRAAYGDEYLGFWVNGTYNIVVNNVIFIDPSGSKRIYKTQLRWLEERLNYALEHHAKQVYVFGHHPWFLYDEEEDPESLTGVSPCPKEWQGSKDSNQNFPDSYFSMPKKYRAEALKLFRQYNVNACFSGHFHQNLVSKTRWGMDMIITGPLSLVFDSNGKTQRNEKEEFVPRRKMTLESEEAMLFDSEGSSSPVSEAVNCRGIRVIDVQVSGSSTTSTYKHFFVPL